MLPEDSSVPPRALYFNDDVYIGYVQESYFLEIAAIDPVRGAVFHALSQEPKARLTFSRHLSFLMYSDGFDALPDDTLREVYLRIRTILDGTDPDPTFRHLRDGDRRAILALLTATTPEFSTLR